MIYQAREGMEFKAKEAYLSKEIVEKYERTFFSVKGRVTDLLEKKLIDKALRLSGLPSGACILDLPCGTGRLSLFLAQKGYKVVGGDISQEMVRRSAENAAKRNFTGNAGFRVVDAQNTGFPDAFFDAVISFRFFGYAPPSIRKQILSEMRRVTKKYVFICYYHKGAFKEILMRRKRKTKKIPWYPVKIHEAENEFTEAGLKKLKHFCLIRGVSESLLLVGQK